MGYAKVSMKGGVIITNPSSLSASAEKTICLPEKTIAHWPHAKWLVVAVIFVALIQLVEEQGFVFADFFRGHSAQTESVRHDSYGRF